MATKTEPRKRRRKIGEWRRLESLDELADGLYVGWWYGSPKVFTVAREGGVINLTDRGNHGLCPPSFYQPISRPKGAR